MSESENKVEHDRNGYLNCQQCSRRYLTLVGFVNHVKLEHGDVNPKQIETKQDSICVSNDVVHSRQFSATTTTSRFMISDLSLEGFSGTITLTIHYHPEAGFETGPKRDNPYLKFEFCCL